MPLGGFAIGAAEASFWWQHEFICGQVQAVLRKFDALQLSTDQAATMRKANIFPVIVSNSAGDLKTVTN